MKTINKKHKQTQKQNHSRPQNVLVLGGKGFIGRYAVKHLAQLGANVIIGTRKANVPVNALTKTAAQDQHVCREVALHKLRRVDDLVDVLGDIDVVVNTVGILRERWSESYDHVHHQAVKLLAEGCAERGIRFVHISALGLTNPLKSRFTQSKLLGEKALQQSNANWAIVRPSLVDGQGGFGARWFRRVATWPVQFIPATANGIFAPIDADDLGEAIARVALLQEPERINSDKVYELGGSEYLNFKEYLNLLRPNNLAGAVYLPVYSFIARALAHVCDVLHITPYSFGHYELLKYGSAPTKNKLATVLGRKPRLVRPHNQEKPYPEVVNIANVNRVRGET